MFTAGRTPRRMRVLVSSGLVLAAFAAACGVSLAQRQDGRKRIGLDVKKGVKVVYQIKTDEWKRGIGSGLHYVRKLVDAYDSLGVDEQDRSVHVVFHGDAGYWMLTDEAYNKFKKVETGNPNKPVIDQIVERGVSIELCAQTMKSNGWTDDDVLPGVTIVIGAYPRIIDLQLQGYAYIRF